MYNGSFTMSKMTLSIIVIDYSELEQLYVPGLYPVVEEAAPMSLMTYMR